MGSNFSVEFDNGKINAYLAAPDDKAKHAAIILIHEIWGLNDHIKDIANRFMQQGYIVLAPDLLSKSGVTEKISQDLLAKMQNPATRDDAQKQMREATAPVHSPEFGAETVGKLQAVFSYLYNHPRSNGQIAIVGFCFGGTYSFALACTGVGLKAAVPFYGRPPEPLEKIKAMKCPVLAFYGEQDTKLMASLPQLKDAMAKYGKQFVDIVYPNTGHAFFNDTNPATYNKEAAVDSWHKTLTFLAQHLR